MTHMLNWSTIWKCKSWRWEYDSFGAVFDLTRLKEGMIEDENVIDANTDHHYVSHMT